jgi:hypothetical protein
MGLWIDDLLEAMIRRSQADMMSREAHHSIALLNCSNLFAAPGKLNRKGPPVNVHLAKWIA